MKFLKWLENNYGDLLILAHRIDTENGEEILHFTLDKFLNKDLSFLDELSDEDKLKYLSRTIKIQSTSKSSQFYREYKKFTTIQNNVILEIQDEEYDEDENDLRIKFIEDQLKQMNWFSSLLFRKWVTTGYSAKHLSEELLIPMSTIQYHLRKVRTVIKKNWNNKNGM